jgi:hypothetical protein
VRTAQDVFQHRLRRNRRHSSRGGKLGRARNLIPLTGGFLLGPFMKQLQLRQLQIEFLELFGLRAKLQRQALAGLTNRIRK